jgi:hypothetical protein
VVHGAEIAARRAMQCFLRRLVPVVLLVSACGESHTSDRDSDVLDAGADAGENECEGTAPYCVSGSASTHVCGDGFPRADCSAGDWTCPPGFVFEGSIDCWCTGRRPPGDCTCEPSGWSCGCPTDVSRAEGMSCGEEGRFCSFGCEDPCGFCNSLHCEGGVWGRLESFPPPPPCHSFACGPDLLCDSHSSYCERVVSDVDPVPDTYRCAPYPGECQSCDCLAEPPSECTGTIEVGITVTHAGG